MILTREYEHFCRDTAAFQRGEVSLALLQRAPQIIFGVNDESRGRHLMHPRHRALSGECGSIRSGIFVAEEEADVARAHERERVEKPSLNDRGSETVVVGGDPRGEVATVRAAHHSEARRVERRILRQRTLEEVDHVVEIDGPHGVPNRSGVLLTVACGTPRVTENHGITGIGIYLEFIHHGNGILGERSAVNGEEYRMRASSRGLHDPSVHGVPVSTDDRYLSRAENADLAQRCGEISDRGECVSIDERKIAGCRGARESDDNACRS